MPCMFVELVGCFLELLVLVVPNCSISSQYTLLGKFVLFLELCCNSSKHRWDDKSFAFTVVFENRTWLC